VGIVEPGKASCLFSERKGQYALVSRGLAGHAVAEQQRCNAWASLGASCTGVAMICKALIALMNSIVSKLDMCMIKG
jgi:hypothetical protein